MQLAFPFARERCEWCGGDAIKGTTCPLSLPCPSCRQPARSWCKRPSGHKAMNLHSERVQHAEALDTPVINELKEDH